MISTPILAWVSLSVTSEHLVPAARGNQLRRGLLGEQKTTAFVSLGYHSQQSWTPQYPLVPSDKNHLGAASNLMQTLIWKRQSHVRTCYIGLMPWDMEPHLTTMTKYHIGTPTKQMDLLVLIHVTPLSFSPIRIKPLWSKLTGWVILILKSYTILLK